VNGQRPESNNYLLDGSEINNRIDGGYALKIPVDSIMEFRILTHTAPPEYGGYSGSTTSVVMKSGSNKVTRDALSEFFRKRSPRLRGTSFRAPWNRSSRINSAGTIGAPIIKDKLFAFGYYEGFRNRQGFTPVGSRPDHGPEIGGFFGPSESSPQQRHRPAVPG
jgi:hypothetical protein